MSGCLADGVVCGRYKWDMKLDPAIRHARRCIRIRSQTGTGNTHERPPLRTTQTTTCQVVIVTNCHALAETYGTA